MPAADDPCEVVITRGGAVAILDHATGEVMHPVVGPLVEPDRIYVAPSRLEGLLRAPDPDGRALVLLDVGLGAGSNAAAVYRLAARLGAESTALRRLDIVSFDNSVAAFELALRPEHAADFGFDPAAAEAARHVLAGERYESPHVSWRLVLGDLPGTLDALPAASADLVFWDPFSPRANPILWTLAAFSALRRVCRDDATALTYSGATATRSGLLLAGFAVGIGEPTGRNKWATIAAGDRAGLAQPLDRRWLERLGRSSAPFPVDAPVDALARIAAMPQFA